MRGEATRLMKGCVQPQLCFDALKPLSVCHPLGSHLGKEWERVSAAAIPERETVGDAVRHGAGDGQEFQQYGMEA